MLSISSASEATPLSLTRLASPSAHAAVRTVWCRPCPPATRCAWKGCRRSFGTGLSRPFSAPHRRPRLGSGASTELREATQTSPVWRRNVPFAQPWYVAADFESEIFGNRCAPTNKSVASGGVSSRVAGRRATGIAGHMVLSGLRRVTFHDVCGMRRPALFASDDRGRTPEGPVVPITPCCPLFLTSELEVTFNCARAHSAIGSPQRITPNQPKTDCSVLSAPARFFQYGPLRLNIAIAECVASEWQYRAKCPLIPSTSTRRPSPRCVASVSRRAAASSREPLKTRDNSSQHRDT